MALLGPGSAPPPAPSAAEAATLPPGFVETTVFSGLTNPTVVRFASDGRVFVGEKSGLIKVFDSVLDTTPTTFADLRTNVHNFWDRGLLGMALHPNFPATPSVYVLYTYDHILGDSAAAPRWGTAGVSSDPCPTPPGPTSDGCVVSGRLSRLQASGNVMTGPEQVLVENWCQQYPSHSVGALHFGPDGALYASAGDGASFAFADYGQDGNPLNPCGDPPGGAGATLTPPTAEGGALRSQDLRTSSDPASLDGAIIRVDPTTGAALPDNPNAGSSDANARRVIAYGLRNPFRFAFRPGTSELWLGDVGWGDYEEINRIMSPTDATVENLGWPCYEGNQRQSGYDSANLNICETLYGQPSADTDPFFAYHHSSKVVTGETCPTGSSSVAGMAFVPSGSGFPAAYQGALFFADYSRDCIWAMKTNGGPAPSPGSIETFAAQAANPVNLEFGPDGNLYYPDFDGGTIRRISTGGSEPPPTCPVGQYGAQYFSNITLSGSSAISRCEAAPINKAWGSGGPGAPVPNDNFSARWTGNFTFPGGDATFSATSDDGIRVWVDGAILIDAWIDQGPTTYTAGRTLSAGNHQVRVEYYERTAGATTQVSWTTSGGSGCPLGQFRGDYFGNVTLTAPVLKFGCVNAIDNTWGQGGPGAPVPNDNFSARWLGQFTFAAGDATFTATADDGIRVWVDGTLIIDAWIDQPPTTYTAVRALTAGTHEVKVEYFERTGGATAQVSWTTAGSSAPTVTARSPSPGALGVAVNVSPTATFSEAMDPATLTPSTFFLIKQGTSTPVAATVNYASLTATLDPTANLDPATSYTATVKGGASGAKDLGGTPLTGDVTWTFTTASAANQPPTPVIDTPSSSLTWKVGDSIAFTGHATDPEQGALPASALTWTLLIQHCPSNCHTHTIQSWDGVAGGSFVAPDHEYPSSLELRLTATDGGGLATSTSTLLQPQTVLLSFASSPAGLQLSVNGASSATPFNRTVIVGSSNSVSATSPQTLGGTTYTFSSWSDGGLQTHNVTAPAAPTTYTATYSSGPPPTCPAGQYSAQYYSNMTLSGSPVLTRCETTINNNWGSGGPGGAVPTNNFSARWTGNFTFPAGDTTFSATADDGIRVWVDGTLIIDAWIDQGPTTYTASRNLTAGTHEVKVEYYENLHGATAQVSW
jgi:glucose/arabinose dehydrogenase